MQWANQITYGFQQLPTMHRNIFGTFPQKRAHCKHRENYNRHHTIPLQKCQKNYTCLLHSLPLPFFMLVDHFLEQLCFFLEIFFPPRNAVINPGSDPSNVRSTKYRDSSACTCSFGIKTETVASSLAMYPFRTFSVQPYKSWIFSSQAVPDITLQVPRS